MVDENAVYVPLQVVIDMVDTPHLSARALKIIGDQYGSPAKIR